jgi:hypothetical protein
MNSVSRPDNRSCKNATQPSECLCDPVTLQAAHGFNIAPRAVAEAISRSMSSVE